MRKTIGGACAVAACLALAWGCGDDGEGGTGGGGSKGFDPAGSPEKSVETVESALSAPTGKVDATSTHSVMQRWKAQGTLGGAMSLTGGAPGGSMGGGLEGKSDGHEHAMQCMTTERQTMTMDMACMSQDQMTGTVKMTTTGSAAGVAWTNATYTAVCAAETCIDGKLAMRTEIVGQTSTITAAGSFTVTREGETIQFNTGWRMSSGPEGLNMEYVVFDDEGNSYVVSASYSASGGTLSIKGANGSYTCEYGAGGDTGTCNGTDGEFSWGG